MSLVFYGHPESGHSYKVALALSMLEIPHEYRWVHVYMPRDRRAADFRTANDSVARSESVARSHRFAARVPADRGAHERTSQLSASFAVWLRTVRSRRRPSRLVRGVQHVARLDRHSDQSSAHSGDGRCTLSSWAQSSVA